jgi:alpha,alpha-trehalose phosphorylase
LPKQWQHYQFKMHLHGCLLQVRVDAGCTEYRLLQGEVLAFTHHGQPVELTVNAAVKELA